MPRPQRLRKIERRLAALCEATGAGLRRLWSYYFARRRRNRERVRRAAQPVTTLAIQTLERRDYLTTLTYSGAGVWNNDPGNKDWENAGVPTAWRAGDIAEFDSSGGSFTVNIAASDDRAGDGLDLHGR